MAVAAVSRAAPAVTSDRAHSQQSPQPIEPRPTEHKPTEPKAMEPQPTTPTANRAHNQQSPNQYIQQLTRRSSSSEKLPLSSDSDRAMPESSLPPLHSSSPGRPRRAFLKRPSAACRAQGQSRWRGGRLRGGERRCSGIGDRAAGSEPALKWQAGECRAVMQDHQGRQEDGERRVKVGAKSKAVSEPCRSQ